MNSIWMFCQRKLYRFFSVKQYAEEFIAGKIRIGKLDVYKGIEDARKDASEGTSSFIWDKPALTYLFDRATRKLLGSAISPTQKIKFKGFISNPYYFLCTSGACVSKKRIAAKFGKYYVKIVDPGKLLKALNQLWIEAPCHYGNVELKKVKYTRGHLEKPNKYLIAPADISFTQKPPGYKNERECRFVFECRINPEDQLPDFKILDIGTTKGIIKNKIYVAS